MLCTHTHFTEVLSLSLSLTPQNIPSILQKFSDISEEFSMGKILPSKKTLLPPPPQKKNQISAKAHSCTTTSRNIKILP